MVRKTLVGAPVATYASTKVCLRRLERRFLLNVVRPAMRVYELTTGTGTVADSHRQKAQAVPGTDSKRLRSYRPIHPRLRSLDVGTDSSKCALRFCKQFYSGN